MIKNFEDITHELTSDELKLVDILVEGFKKISKIKPINGDVICETINNKYHLSPKLTPPRLRKLVNYIRINKIIPLIATSKGYFVSYDENDIQDEIDSLKERAGAIMKAANGLSSFLKVKEKTLQLF